MNTQSYRYQIGSALLSYRCLYEEQTNFDELNTHTDQQKSPCIDHRHDSWQWGRARGLEPLASDEALAMGSFCVAAAHAVVQGTWTLQELDKLLFDRLGKCCASAKNALCRNADG